VIAVDNVDLPNWFNYVKPNFSQLPKDSELSILQIGVYKGDCTEYILENYRVKQIVDVDTWEGSMEHPDLNITFNVVEDVYDSKFSDDKRVKKNEDDKRHVFRR